MNTLIIEPDSKLQYQQFVNLAKKLNVTFREEKAKAKNIKKSKEKSSFAEAELLIKQKNEDAFFALAGSFDLPETADELINIIEGARSLNKEMDTSWRIEIFTQ